MGKTKSKKTNKNELDNKYNLIIRNTSAQTMKRCLQLCCNDFNEELVEEVINYMKDIYFELDKQGVDELIDPIYFVNILDYIHDIIILSYNKRKITDEFKVIANKLISIIKENDIKIELLVYVSKVGVLYENPEIYPENIGGLYAKVACSITDLMYILYQYTATYTYKFKNYQIDCFYIKDGKVEIKYSTLPMLLKEQIDKMNAFLLNKNNDTKFYEKYSIKIAEEIHRAYSNFMARNIDKEYYDEFSGYLHVEHSYDFPLFDENNKFMISSDLINKIPHERKYAINNAGIRFEFLNRDIKYIDMKENKDTINFNVYIINKGGLYTTKIDTSEKDSYLRKYKGIATEKQLIERKLFKISFLIDKKGFEDFKYNEKELNTFIICLGYMGKFRASDLEVEFFNKLAQILLGCTYIAYYDPNMFKDIQLRNKIHNKKNGYKRNSGFRIGHLMRLPAGRKMSEEALLNAKKEGFDYIPEGYTYVKTVNIFNSRKKVIKIDK